MADWDGDLYTLYSREQVQGHLTLSASSSWTSLMSSLILGTEPPLLKANRFTETPTCLELSRPHVLLAVFLMRLGQEVTYWLWFPICHLRCLAPGRNPRREGAGSLLTLRSAAPPAARVRSVRRISSGFRHVLIRQNAEAQQGERQDHFHLSHGEGLPNGSSCRQEWWLWLPPDLPPSLIKPEIWPTTPIPICRDRRSWTMPGFLDMGFHRALGLSRFQFWTRRRKESSQHTSGPSLGPPPFPKRLSVTSRAGEGRKARIPFLFFPLHCLTVMPGISVPDAATPTTPAFPPQMPNVPHLGPAGEGNKSQSVTSLDVFWSMKGLVWPKDTGLLGGISQDVHPLERQMCL